MEHFLAFRFISRIHLVKVLLGKKRQSLKCDLANYHIQVHSSDQICYCCYGLPPGVRDNISCHYALWCFNGTFAKASQK